MNYIRLNIFIYYMKQAKQGLVTVQKEGLTLTMSIVQKESNTGLLYNQRLFVLNQGHFFGYISKFKLTDDPNKINLINVKSSVPIKFIKSIQCNQDVLTIKFLEQNQLKIVQKSWLLKMANEKMVQEWYKKLQEEKAKKTHRSNSKKSRDSKQKQESANKNQNKESASKIPIITNENKHTKSQTNLQQNKEINKNQTGSSSMMNNINNQKSSPQIKKTQISQKQKQQQKQKQKLLRQRQRQRQIYQRERQKQKGKDRQKQRQKIQINNQHQEVEQFVNPLYTGYDSIQQQANMRNKETKKPQEKTVKKTQKLQKKQKESLFILSKVQEQEDGVYVNKNKKSINQTKKQEIKSEIDNQNDPTNSRFFKESKQNQLYRQPKSKQPQQRFANNPLNISQSKNNPKQKLFEKQIKEPIIIQEKQPLSLIKKTNVSIKDQSNYMEMISKLVADSNKKSKQSIQFMYGQTEQLKRKYNLSEDVQQLQKDPEQKKRLQIVHEYALNLQKQNMRNELRNKMFQKNIKVSNENLLLSIEDMPWSYRYLVNDSPDTCSAFRRYSQQILKKIVDQFPQNQAKTNFKPKIKKNNILIYNFQECQIKIALIVLKQISTKGQKKQAREERICDYTSHKQLQVQYKNYCALNFYIQNKSKLKVPLICLTQYNGFLALFKVNSKFSHHNVIDQNLIQKQQKQITNLSKIQTDLISSNSKFLVMKIDQKYYRELDESFKLMKSFDYHIVQEVDDFLIHDFLSKSNPNLILRRELLEQQKMNQAQITYKNIRADKIKSSNNINKTDITKIQNLSKKVLQNISSFIICLDNLSFYFLHPKQLSENIHKYGINMRYLGLIYDNTTLKFSKINIMTQIAARACKLLLRKTQQDLYLEKSESGFFTQQDLLFKMMDFLNCIVGNTYQTAAIWKVLSFHSQFYFKIPINLQQIQKGLFLICLSYHCNLIFQWSKINPNEVFKTNDFFTSQNLLSLGTKSKCYEPIHNEKYRKTLDLMNEQTQENFNEIATILNLHQNNIPSYFLQHNKQVKIKKYLAHFIQPTSILNTNSFPHLHIFQTSEVISKDEFDIALMEIKWYFRQNKKDKYIKCCEAIVSKVNKYFGDFHPVLNQIYDLFSNYHINKSQYEDGTTFAKSSLVNILKICGTNHQKTSQCYFNLAMCYIKSNKKEEALNLLKKSKIIFQNNQKTQTTPYAVINLKMGLLYLNQSNIDQCIKCAQLSLSIFTNPQEDTKKLTTYEDQTTQAYQLLSRCFQLKKSKQNLKKLGQKCEKILSKIISPSNLQRAMKIILYPLLSTMPTADASLYLDILSMIPLQITTKSYGRSFGLLKIRIKQDSLVENLKNYLQNIQSIDKFISENQTLKNWRPSQKLYQRQTVNDFIALSQQFLYFLGEGFMTGSLRQAL